MTAAPSWLPTARALAEVWAGPALVQFVVIEVRPSRCTVCDDVWSEGANRCDKCGSVLRLKPVRTEAGTVPDLSSGPGGLANVGPLRYAVRDADPHAAVRWIATTATCRPIAGWCVIGGGNAVTLAAYRQNLAHALALALLAMPR